MSGKKEPTGKNAGKWGKNSSIVPPIVPQNSARNVHISQGFAFLNNTFILPWGFGLMAFFFALSDEQ